MATTKTQPQHSSTAARSKKETEAPQIFRVRKGFAVQPPNSKKQADLIHSGAILDAVPPGQAHKVEQVEADENGNYPDVTHEIRRLLAKMGTREEYEQHRRTELRGVEANIETKGKELSRKEKELAEAEKALKKGAESLDERETKLRDDREQLVAATEASQKLLTDQAARLKDLTKRLGEIPADTDSEKLQLILKETASTLQGLIDEIKPVDADDKSEEKD